MDKKLREFIKRNRRRNSQLYQSGLIYGQDYVICPVSNERMSMIKSNYIEKVLGLTVVQYDQLYPGARSVCNKRKENIKHGLKQIDQTTGLTKYQISQQKAKQILSIPDQNGITGYKKKGQKTRATHMSNIDQFGRNGYSQLASKAIIKGNNTKAINGLISLNKDVFKRYKTVVLYLTEKYRKSITSGYTTGLAGKENAWHIDHKFSILKGYQQKISPFVIGHVTNLQMISWKENISKHSKCSVHINELLSKCNYTVEKSNFEFDKIIQLINEDIKNSVPPNAAYLIERYYETNLLSKY
jgi:hypothetical protein